MKHLCQREKGFSQQPVNRALTSNLLAGLDTIRGSRVKPGMTARAAASGELLPNCISLGFAKQRQARLTKMSTLASIFLVLCLLILTSCATAPGLGKMETQLYTSLAGYHITLPAAWQLVEEEPQSAVFAAPEGDISLTIISELGGEAYYGLGEIADMLLAELAGSSIPWQISHTVVDMKEKLRLTALGEDAQGAEVGLDITILQPYPGMRYYLLFAAGYQAIARQEALIGDIGKSFGMDEGLPYLYALMNEWRKQE